MANDTTAFWERLTAESGDYNKALVGELAALDAVYLDLSPEAARRGQTIRIPFPDVGAFTDQGANDWTLEDEVVPWVEVSLGERPAKGIIINDFEQVLTQSSLMPQFFDPFHKRAMEYANKRIFDLCTTAQFNAYPAITCIPGHISIGNVKTAWNIFTRNKIPINDANRASILYHPDVHANTLDDSTWYQESLVGAAMARDTRQNVAMGDGNIAFRFRRKWDQQAPTSTTALAGTHSVTNGLTTVTGTSTAYILATPAGSWVTFSSDPTNSYQVAATALSDTALVLTQPYSGTTAAAATGTRTTYTSVAMHKYAIALVVRPLELVNTGQTTSRLVNLGGLPVRAQLSYEKMKNGWVFTMDYVMVAKVIRPSFGIVLQS